MATRSIGLDVGTFAVRAAELTLGSGPPTLTRFGQVTLPVGAMRDGEVVEIDVVASAIRRLWAEAGFRSRDVVVGVSNLRVVVRQAEMPALSDAEMASALQFEAPELIPIPVDDAIIDFQVIDEFVSPAGEPRAHIVLAAAQRDMVRNLVAAVQAAGLTPTLIDVLPFALIRAARLGDGGAEVGAEALISVGAGVTNVVVHESGIPRFGRVLPVGGEDLTEAVATQLDLDLDTAEDLKRRGLVPGDEASERAATVITDRLGPLVDEIRGSLDFYLAQPDAVPIQRIVLTGGTSRLPGIRERLSQQLNVPVDAAHPLGGLRLGRLGLTPEQLADAEPLLTVAVGVALAGTPLPKGERRISLMPAEVAEVREVRRQTTLVATGVAGLGVLLVLLWLLRGSQVASERQKADDAEARAAAVQRQIAELGDTTALQADLLERRTGVRAALENDVAWTRLLQEVATVIPNDVWLTGFNGTSASGLVTFSASGFDQTSTARWLLRLSDLTSLANSWVSSSTKPEGRGPAALVTFTSTASLTPAAQADRAERYGAPKP